MKKITKKPKLWPFILLLPIAALYFYSPPGNLTIEINADPQGVQEFYVRTTSSRSNFHGRTVKNIDARLVQINQKITIPLNRHKTLWFGRLVVDIYHPEYFSETKGVDNDYISPGVQLTPTAWEDVIKKPPRWETQAPSYELASSQYRDDSISHRVINMYQVHNQVSLANSKYIDMYLQNGDVNRMRESVKILDLIVKEFDKSISTVGNSEFINNYINEIHEALDNIHKIIQ